MGNLNSPEIGRSSAFFLQRLRTLSYLPENFRSLPIPDKNSKFPEEFYFLPKQALHVRVVTPRSCCLLS